LKESEKEAQADKVDWSVDAGFQELQLLNDDDSDYLVNINQKAKGKEKALYEESEEESFPLDPKDFDVNYSLSYTSNNEVILASSSKTILPPFLQSNYGTRSKTYMETYLSDRSYDADKPATKSASHVKNPFLPAQGHSLSHLKYHPYSCTQLIPV
jgi:hypothetical protein